MINKLLTFFFFILILSMIPRSMAANLSSELQQPGDPAVNKMLLNGRIWFNRHPRVQGDPFFINDLFREGSVVFNGKKFYNLSIKYNIFDDEVILSVQGKPIIIMNKEMVDSFDINFEGRDYHFINTGYDTTSVLKGYVGVLYNGSSTFFVKYSKKIMPLAVDGKFDLFYQEHRMYIKQDSTVVQFSGRLELFKLLEHRKKELRKFVRDNNLRITKKEPSTFIPLLEYYDKINY